MYVIGLDASTSTIGMSIFNPNGELMLLTHFKPKKKKNLMQHEMLIDKCEQFIEFLTIQDFKKEDIKTIVIEKALISSTNLFTAAMLNFYQGIFYAKLKLYFNETTIFKFITVDESRRIVMPELLAKNKTGKNILWKALPRSIRDVKIGSYKKLAVLNAISARYPEIEWNLNNNKTLNETCFDRADAMVVGLSELIINHELIQKSYDIQENINIINSYLEYLEWVKTVKGTVKEKKVLKKYYLEDVCKLDQLINFKVYD